MTAAGAIAELARLARGIRERVFAHTLANNGGYLSQACSSAEILACLYGGLVNLAPLLEPTSPRSFAGVPSVGHQDGYFTGAEYHGAKNADRDRLIISPAHYALVIYAALIQTGRLTEESLDQFNKDGSTVEMIGAEHSPGFETTTGSLAQAISQAGGIALARKIRRESGKTWVLMSDGEFQEGQTWEALSAASYHGLSNLRIIVDVNGQQCDGPMDSVMTIEPLCLRLESFGWRTTVVDGHDITEILKAGTIESAEPYAILCYTDPARGIPLLNERAPVLHYLRFTGAEERARYERAYEEFVHGA